MRESVWKMKASLQEWCKLILPIKNAVLIWMLFLHFD